MSTSLYFTLQMSIIISTQISLFLLSSTIFYNNFRAVHEIHNSFLHRPFLIFFFLLFFFLLSKQISTLVFEFIHFFFSKYLLVLHLFASFFVYYFEFFSNSWNYWFKPSLVKPCVIPLLLLDFAVILFVHLIMTIFNTIHKISIPEVFFLYFYWSIIIIHDMGYVNYFMDTL